DANLGGRERAAPACNRSSLQEQRMTIGVAGAGTMGAGIAIVAARAGFRTVLYDVERDPLERALSDASSFLARSVEKGRLDAADAEHAVARLSTTTELQLLAEASLVIEAVFENID